MPLNTSSDHADPDHGVKRLKPREVVAEANFFYISSRLPNHSSSSMDSLVAYGSSDESESAGAESSKSPKRKRSSTADVKLSLPQCKKRKLPSLSRSLTVPIPESLPSKHQGRIRTHPHVEGQFASYVYVPVSLERDDGGGIGRLVSRAVKYAKAMVPSINPIVEERAKCNGEEEDDAQELHVSLSRPVYLRHHQREDFKRAVEIIASSNVPFLASFATFASFTNDDKTRAFLALEVGAGHSQFHGLSEKLAPTLCSLYQKEYYAQPRFHASFAWALLDPPAELQPSSYPEVLSDADVTLSSTVSDNCPSQGFPTIPELPPSLLGSLTEQFGERLRRCGKFDVTEIKVRIGKAVVSYPLRGH